MNDHRSIVSLRAWLCVSAIANVVLLCALGAAIVAYQDFVRRAEFWGQTMRDDFGQIWFVREYNDTVVPHNLEHPPMPEEL